MFFDLFYEYTLTLAELLSYNWQEINCIINDHSIITKIFYKSQKFRYNLLVHYEEVRTYKLLLYVGNIETRTGNRTLKLK